MPPRHAGAFGFARESLVPVSTVSDTAAIAFAGAWTPEPVPGDGARVVASGSASTVGRFSSSPARGGTAGDGGGGHGTCVVAPSPSVWQAPATSP